MFKKCIDSLFLKYITFALNLNFYFYGEYGRLLKASFFCIIQKGRICPSIHFAFTIESTTEHSTNGIAVCESICAILYCYRTLGYMVKDKQRRFSD